MNGDWFQTRDYLWRLFRDVNDFSLTREKNTRKIGKNLSKHLSISGFAKKLIFDSRAQDWSTRNDEHGKARKIGQDPES